MILPEHVQQHAKLADMGAFTGEMLLLGDQVSRVLCADTAVKFFTAYGAETVTTLDPDYGDLELDLNTDLGMIAGQYDSVFNLGTIEHVWNAHNAWANALRAVKTGGMFASHSPVSDYAGHGIHVTSAVYIQSFIAANGFDVIDAWITREHLGEVLWLAARKVRHIANLTEFSCPQQVYRSGRKSRSPVCGGASGAVT